MYRDDLNFGVSASQSTEEKGASESKQTPSVWNQCFERIRIMPRWTRNNEKKLQAMDQRRRRELIRKQILIDKKWLVTTKQVTPRYAAKMSNLQVRKLMAKNKRVMEEEARQTADTEARAARGISLSDANDFRRMMEGLPNMTRALINGMLAVFGYQINDAGEMERSPVHPEPDSLPEPS